jgi:K+-transporting ATPase ATPase C chain
MKSEIIMQNILCSVRLVIVSIVVCCILYTAVVWAVGAVLVPDKAEGSLIHDASGEVIGSRQIAQKFTRPEYFWPRPSAVDYNAAATGGSNKSPLNPELTTRATGIIEQLKPEPGKLVPADLLAASGSGMDPHITRDAAVFQAPRIAAARQLSLQQVQQSIDAFAYSPDGLGLAASDERIVNVLELNLALDAKHPLPGATTLPTVANAK